MQGSGVSSESIWTIFDSITTASVRNPKYQVKVAWKRLINTAGFAVVGTSLVNGMDVVEGINGVIFPPDQYVFTDESEHVLGISYERFLEEPQGGIAQARGEVTLDNTTLRFTPSFNATIGTAMLPNRPLQIFVGLKVRDAEKLLAVLKGLTETPRETKDGRTVSIPVKDYMAYLNDLPLETAIYQNQRSDQIIAAILTTAGVGTSQYELDQGLNTIGFAWFAKGETAGERIRKICEAEEAKFYQDEIGKLRFENRRHFIATGHTVNIWTIEPDDIYHWEEDRSVPIINRCIVNARPRAVQSTQEIWRDGIVEEIPVGTTTIWAQFDDPVTSFTSPVATTDYVANSASDGTGDNLTSSISISLTAFTTTAKLEITNSGSVSAHMTLLRLRGMPAIVQSEIRELFQDNDSINKHDEHQLEITNDFIDSDSFAYYFARAIVRRYKEPFKRLRIRVQGIPQLQLMDRIRVKDQDLGTYSNYRVMGIAGEFTQAGFFQDLTLREITDIESDNWAIVDTSTVEGNDVVGL